MFDELCAYIKRCRPHIVDFCWSRLEQYQDRMPTHPGQQKLPGGKNLHTLQVIKHALALNQSHDERDIIETCLVHDLRGCETLDLYDHQQLAIAATKGKVDYDDWRITQHYRFVVLILISDMWSAFINVNDLRC